VHILEAGETTDASKDPLNVGTWLSEEVVVVVPPLEPGGIPMPLLLPMEPLRGPTTCGHAIFNRKRE